MVCGYACVCAHMLTLPHALTESQFDQSALGALLLCFVIPGFLAMGWQFVKVSTEAKSVSSASSAMKLVNEEAAKRADSEEEGGSGRDVQRAKEGATRKAETELSPCNIRADESAHVATEARAPKQPEQPAFIYSAEDDTEFQVMCYATADVNGV